MNQEKQFTSRLMIALDFATEADADQFLAQVAGIPCTMKVGMELFYRAGPAFLSKLKDQGYAVFVDLKLHDIPNTVRGAARTLTRLGVDMFNVHASGGLQMMEAALAGVDDAMNDYESSPVQRPVVIGVTQLTSTNQHMLNEEIGIPGSIEKSVVHYAKLSQRAGLQGVVASAHEVPLIKQACGSDFITVTPGIRMQSDVANDQHRVMTPDQAFAAGTDYIVMGRPITQARHPRERIELILASLS